MDEYATFSRFLCLIISRKVKMQQKHKESEVYGEGAVTDLTCQKWFVKFCARDFSLDDAPQSGRTVEADSDQMETLIENNHTEDSQTYHNIQIIKLLVKMKNTSFILWKKTQQTFWPTQHFHSELGCPV